MEYICLASPISGLGGCSRVPLNFLEWLTSYTKLDFRLVDGEYFPKEVQEYVLDQAIAIDASVAGIEETYMAIALELYRTPSVRFYLSQALNEMVVVRPPVPHPPAGHHPQSVGAPPNVPPPPPQRVRPRRLPGIARLPAGWHHFRCVDMESEIAVPVRTMKTIPRRIRDQFFRIMTS